MATATLKEKEIPRFELPELDVLRKYTYVLSLKNEARGRVFDENGNRRPDPEYPPRRNLLYRSSIVWPKDTYDPFNPEKVRKAGRHLIRYYDGCTTLFVDDQPSQKDVIDQLVSSTKDRWFENGYLAVFGYDKLLKIYMDWASWCADSEFRVPTTDPIYLLLDSDKSRELEAMEMDKMEEAMEKAKKSVTPDSRMMIHARFLNIPSIDSITSQVLSPDAIRTEYRKSAKNNPAEFLKTYNDKTLSTKYWVEKAMTNGDISTTIIPNKAVWKKEGSVICDISGLKASDSILNKLIEFSETADGAEFKENLSTKYDK